ncbi:zinc finger MYM-type protein 1-like [Rhopalosiphum padi]|uniref:zinc finger MYM-type protein 1-like n=1 Tax=Rhopalosiphum padi TaxID=40932 RepID=UPI00298E2E9A|nr:zinc finger MYM-type protein 1-like [Rhopalosiphum padi]
MESKKLFNIFNNKNKSTTTSTSSTVSTKIDVAQNISVSIITATNTNIVNSDDESNTNNTPSGYLDLGDLNSGPMRPILKVYPKTKFGQQNRSFSSTHYKKFSWIEYSIKNDAIFCYACRLFSNNNVEQTFISIGFNNWKKLSGYRDSKVNCTKLELHNRCIHHLTAMSKWSGHNSMKKNGSVHNKIVSASMQQIKENRTYMMQLIEITLFLSKQGIAFRGHRENELSINRGFYF